MIFNNPNFQKVDLDSTETQRPSIQEVVDKYQNKQSLFGSPERATFGQSYKIQSKTQNDQIKVDEQNISNVLSDFSIISQNETHTNINQLRDKVLKIIQSYEHLQTNKAKIDEKKLQSDISQIALEYSQYSQQLEKSSNTEYQNICVLVENFLQRYQKSKDLDISIMSQIPTDESFYQSQEIYDKRFQSKLQDLRDQLKEILQQQQFVETQQILNDMLKQLDIIIQVNDAQTIKTVIYKIQDKIQKLSIDQNVILELYDYIKKAFKISQQKLKEREQQDYDQIEHIMRQRNPKVTAIQKSIKLLDN
ncbi:hypothetical protein pb186bvf_008781 [Paramecium bursaria]